jgi:hypothetical protein
MSNTVNVGNFSVECFHSLDFIRVGEPLDDYQQIILTLVPDTGYSIDANNFSVILPYPDYVSSVAFTQSNINPANVICTVILQQGAVMPNSDIIIDLCIKGIATNADTTVAGNVTYAQAINVLPATLNASYTANGAFGQTKNVFTQVITAEPGTYFVSTPVIAITSGNMADYSVSYSNSTNAQGQIISTTIELFYTFGNTSISGDSWEIAAAAFAPTLKINDYVTLTNLLPEAGATRTYTVIGDEGAEYTLTSNEPIFDAGNTVSVYNGVIPSGGQEIVTLYYPSILENTVYSITIAGNFSGSFSKPTTVQVPQYINVTISYNATGADVTVTPSSGYSETGLSKSGNVSTNLSFLISSNLGLTLNSVSSNQILNLITNWSETTNIVFDGGGASNVQRVVDISSVVPGMSFYESNFADGITVQSIDVLTKEITFSESITTTNNSNANLSFANDNRVVFTNISTTQETNGDLTLDAIAYIQYFGWADATFTFDLDNILVIPDPVGSVTTTTAVINGDVATSGGESLNANGGTIEEKFLVVYDVTDDTTIQIDCECGGGTANYSINFDLTSGHQYEYYAIIQSGGGTFATGTALTYTHP